MGKFTFILIFVMWFGFSKAQNYMQNVPFDTTLNAGSYNLSSGCTSAYQLKIQLSPALYSYVSGMNFMVVIDSVNYPGPMSSCPVKPGDTTVLNAANPMFSTIGISGLKYWFRIELAGTPTTASQSYPCHLQISQCTCFCTDITIQPSATNTSVCSVDLFNSVNELSDSERISVFPNPAGNLLSIKGKTNPAEISVYNNFGQLVLTEHANGDGNFDISNLTQGIYWVSFTDENQKAKTARLVIQK